MTTGAGTAGQIINDLTQSDFSDLDLKISRVADLSADTHNASSRVRRDSQFGILRGAYFDHMLDGAECLHVVDDSGAHIKAQSRRKIGRFQTRLGAISFQGAQGSGFFTADIGTGTAMDVNFQVVAAIQDILAQEISGSGFIQSPVQNFSAFVEFTPDVDVGQVNIVGEAGNDHSLDELMRVFVDDLSILEGAGLRLIAVANQVDRLTGGAVHKGPFEAGREACTAAAAKAGSLYFISQLLLWGKFFAVLGGLFFERKRFFQSFVATFFQITRKSVIIIFVIQVLEDESVFLRHKTGFLIFFFLRA